MAPTEWLGFLLACPVAKGPPFLPCFLFLGGTVGRNATADSSRGLLSSFTFDWIRSLFGFFIVILLENSSFFNFDLSSLRMSLDGILNRGSFVLVSVTRDCPLGWPPPREKDPLPRLMSAVAGLVLEVVVEG